MTLDEAIAVYLYLHNNTEREKYPKAFAMAWGLICGHAAHVLSRHPERCR